MRQAITRQVTERVMRATVDGVDSQYLRVLIADNHDEVLHATRDLVGELPEVEIVALAQDVDAAVQAVERLKPDLVLVDAWLKGGGAVEASKRIRAVAPQTAVAVMTSVVEVELARSLESLGCCGCFEKEHLGASLPGILARVRQLRAKPYLKV
jgi:two-component system response regulator NreC